MNPSPFRSDDTERKVNQNPVARGTAVEELTSPEAVFRLTLAL